MCAHLWVVEDNTPRQNVRRSVQSEQELKPGWAARLTCRIWPEAALWMTPTFSGQLVSQWATCFFFPTLPFVLIGHPGLSRQGQNAAEQQTQIVAINFRLVYGLGLLAHLLVNSCNRHCCPPVPSCWCTDWLDPNFTLPNLHFVWLQCSTLTQLLSIAVPSDTTPSILHPLVYLIFYGTVWLNNHVCIFTIQTLCC